MGPYTACSRHSINITSVQNLEKSTYISLQYERLTLGLQLGPDLLSLNISLLDLLRDLDVSLGANDADGTIKHLNFLLFFSCQGLPLVHLLLDQRLLKLRLQLDPVELEEGQFTVELLSELV